jgi:deazaflavin-dependent oxidoreductase (nitroreductase family)
MAGKPDIHSINAAMVAKTLSEPEVPLEDGKYALRAVETTGRRSGAPREVPLAVIQRDSRRYLVSPVRHRDWVANLLANPACAVLSSAGRRNCRAEAVDGTEAVAVVGQYLASMTVPWAVRAFPVAQDAGPAEIHAHLPRMAVFRLAGA